MATAGISRVPTAALPPHPQTSPEVHSHHAVLQHHHNAYSVSCGRPESGHTRQPTLPSHAYDKILPAKPPPAAQRPNSARVSVRGSPVPLTEYNVAILERQHGPPASISISSPRQQSPRKQSSHAKTHNEGSSSRGSRHSHGLNSGLASPTRQNSETRRQLPIADLEKQTYVKNDWSSGEHYYSTYSEDDLETIAAEPTTHNLRALLHLCSTAPLISFCVTMYTIAVLLFTSVASIFHLCIPGKPAFREYTTPFLAAPLRLQLRCVQASPSSAQIQQKSLSKILGPLVLVHLLAPLASLPMMFAAWIVAIFWALSALVADEGGNGDGKMLAVTLSDWWVWWLEGRAFR